MFSLPGRFFAAVKAATSIKLSEFLTVPIDILIQILVKDKLIRIVRI